MAEARAAGYAGAGATMVVDWQVCYRGGRLELTCRGIVAALVNHKDRVVLTSHLAYFSTTTGSGMGRT